MIFKKNFLFRFDIGNVISQQEIALRGHELYPELHEKLAKIGGKALADVMERLPNVLDQAVPQDESLVTAGKTKYKKQQFLEIIFFPIHFGKSKMFLCSS